MSIAPFAALSGIQLLDNYEVALFMAGNHHLGNALAVVHHEVLL